MPPTRPFTPTTRARRCMAGAAVTPATARTFRPSSSPAPAAAKRESSKKGTLRGTFFFGGALTRAALEGGGMTELTILMPCLNEAATVGRCVEKARGFLRRAGIEGEVVVADNGSHD